MARKIKNYKKKQTPCSFCLELCNEEDVIIGMNQTTICNECVEIANSILRDKKGIAEEETQKEDVYLAQFNELTPSKIKKQLDEYVVGQEQAKKVLSVAVYNHFKRITALKEDEIDKTNVCLIGETGSGKTLLVKTIAKLLDIPFVIVDANSFTAAGYSGKNVDECLMSLVQKADGDVKKAEKGIIFIDEIDKIAKRETNGRDVGGEAVQQALLKIIEGTIVDVNNKYDDFNEDVISINTADILFIVGGAFIGIEKIIKNKSSKQSIGFGAEISINNGSNAINNVTQEDLIKFGMIPEFVGRIQTVAVLQKLDEETLVQVLTVPKNSLIKQYTKLMRADGIDFEIDSNAIKKIANIAVKQKTGARSLKSILDATMLDYMFSSPDKKHGKIKIKEEDVVFG